jgi:hypothetical protein
MGLYDYCEVVDTYGNRIRLRTSSLASEHGPCAWIFCEDTDGRGHHTGVVGCPDGVLPVRPHLDLRAAELLRDALQRFIDDAKRELDASDD